MFDRRIMNSKLGFAAFVSIAAMITFNVMVATQQFDTAPQRAIVATSLVELA